MTGVDGLALPRPVVNAPEDLVGPAMGRDGESTDRWRQVGEPSGKERRPTSRDSLRQEWPEEANVGRP